MMAEASVAGRAASLFEAVAAAAALLRTSRRPVIAGLETDIEGVEAAVSLARRLGAALDHRHAAACLRDQEAMRGGWIVTTPLQMRARADRVLLAGPGLEPDRLRLDRPPRLGAGRARKIRAVDGRAETIGPVRARLAGRPAGAVPESVAALAAWLAEASYGVVVWRAENLDALDLAMLCGLVEDLNAHTRYAGLPLPPDTAAGAMQAAAWLTGHTLPLGFSGPGGPPRHDPYLFDATRLVDSGEADAAVWIAADAVSQPAWSRPVPMVALTAAEARLDPAAAVAIAVGRPGVDHDSVLFDGALGVLAARAASAASGAPRCAEVLRSIEAALPC